MGPGGRTRLEQHRESAPQGDGHSLNLLSIVGDDGRHAVPKPKREANETVMQVLRQEVNHPMGQTPSWAPREMRNPAPNIQCASTASNVYREAMLASHVIDSKDSRQHRDLTQVLVPNWVAAMERAGLAREIPRSQIRPGDAVVGQGGVEDRAKNNDRHVGFVGAYDEHTKRFAAYSNSMGKLKEQDLDERFGIYRQEHFYRLYLPN